MPTTSSPSLTPSQHTSQPLVSMQAPKLDHLSMARNTKVTMAKKPEPEWKQAVGKHRISPSPSHSQQARVLLTSTPPSPQLMSAALTRGSSANSSRRTSQSQSQGTTPSGTVTKNDSPTSTNTNANSEGQTPTHAHSHARPSPTLTAKHMSTVTTVLVSDTTIEVDPYDALTAALVPDARLSLSYHSSIIRFYVLTLFCLVSAMQGSVYVTFSTVPTFSNLYLNQSSTDQTLLSLLLNWQPIIYIPFVLFAAYFQKTVKNSLRKSVCLAALCMALGTIVRAVPSFVTSDARQSNIGDYLIAIHIGQILNALTAPLMLSLPSTLSVTWFGDGERATATALGIISNGFGIGASYLIFPTVIQSCSGQVDEDECDMKQISLLLQVTAGIAVALFALTLAYFPSQPKQFPSSLAAQRSSQNLTLFSFLSQQSSPNNVSFMSGLWQLLKSLSFVCLIVGVGILTGVNNVWSATLPSTLQHTPFTLEQSASFVTITRFAAILGGLIGGSLADRPIFRFRQKSLLIVFLYFSLLSFATFTLTQPSIASTKPLLPNNWYLLSMLSVGSGGFFIGASLPLAYELGAELVYPVDESISSAFIVLIMQASSLIMFTLAPRLNRTITDSRGRSTILTINSVMTLTVSVSLLLCACIKEKYRRYESGRRYEVRNQGVAAVLRYYDALDELVSPTNIIEGSNGSRFSPSNSTSERSTARTQSM